MGRYVSHADIDAAQQLVSRLPWRPSPPKPQLPRYGVDPAELLSGG